MARVQDIFDDLEEDFPWQEHIERRPEVMLGKPVCQGTRMTMELVLAELGNGTTWDELIAGYPNLTFDRIRAALHFAAWLSRRYRLGAPEVAEGANERKATPLAD